MNETMKNIAELAAKYQDSDITRLILDKGKYPQTDMEAVVSCIECRKKLKGKVPQWYEDKRLVFPAKISAEQCSSSATAAYKTDLAERITGKVSGQWRIADLTGGLGVDSWFFSQKAEKVLYNEMQEILCRSSEYNFNILGAGNIIVSNHRVSDSDNWPDMTPETLLKDFEPDIIFLDPARRGAGGKKVFLIEDCSPDVLSLKESLFSTCRHILIKLSPMADITMVCRRLGAACREVHVIGVDGECKELLVWMDRDWNGEYSIISCELHAGRESIRKAMFSFKPSEESDAVPEYCTDAEESNGRLLFEPGKALMKAGAFNLISSRFALKKLGKSTHYYILDGSGKTEELMMLGKLFRITSSSRLDKQSIRQTGRDYPRAEVTARNIPMDTDTLRKKLGAASGDRTHIFGLKSDITGNLLFVTERILSSDVQA